MRNGERRRRTCLALHARFVPRSPEKTGGKAPVLQAMFIMNIKFLKTELYEGGFFFSH